MKFMARKLFLNKTANDEIGLLYIIVPSTWP